VWVDSDTVSQRQSLSGLDADRLVSTHNLRESFRGLDYGGLCKERTGPTVCTIDSDVSQAVRGGGGDVAATQAELMSQGHRRSDRPRGKWLARSRQRGAQDQGDRTGEQCAGAARAAGAGWTLCTRMRCERATQGTQRAVTMPE
jgi:hypothetical protein